MKFKQYLLNEDRSKAISKEDAFKWIEKNCKNALKQAKKGNIIFRGVSRTEDALLIDPSKSKTPRRSAYVGSNYYTLLIDNLPSWSKFPKRSQSIVCSTSKSKAADYGVTSDPYIVFPKDGSKIGVCSKDDIFFSFPHLFKKFDIKSMSTFSDFMEALDKSLGRAGSDSSWNLLKNMFKDLDSTDVRELDIDMFAMDKINQLKGNSLKKMNDLLDPKKNRFELKTIGDTIPHSREVWTDGESILLSQSAFEEMTGVGEEHSSFVSRHPIDDLLIMRDDLYRSYINFNKPKYPANDEQSVFMEFLGNGKYRYMAINNLAPIIKAIMEGRPVIDLVIVDSGKNPYSTVDEKWKYKRKLKFKNLEDLADDESLEDDKENWEEEGILK